MPHLPAVAHRVGSSAVPTPQRIIDGGHPGFGGHPQRTVPVESQIYGMILPRQGFPSPRAVAGASHADAIRLNRGGGARSRRRTAARKSGRGYAGDQWDKCYATCMNTSNPGLCLDEVCSKYLGVPDAPSSSSRPAAIRGAVRRAGKRRVKRKAKKRKAKRMAFAGKSHADAVRLGAIAGADVPPYPGIAQRHAAQRAAGRSSVAGSMYPPSYPDYPGNAQRREASRGRAARGGMAGSMTPPSYPDYPGNGQRRDAARGRAARGGMAGYAGHDHGKSDEPCCDSCVGGGPCEGCDGAGGCGKPNCACNQA